MTQNAREIMARAMEADGSSDTMLGVADTILAALSDAGLVVVPKEPTEAMIAAGIHAPCWEPDAIQFGPDYVNAGGARMFSAPIYRAMLAAKGGE